MMTTLHSRVTATKPGPSRGRVRSNAARLQRSQRISGYLFILPIVALFAVFVGYPILRTIYLSFTSWGGFGDPQFNGGANYARMVSDPVAIQAFVITLIFTGATVILQTVVPLVIAVLVNMVWRRIGVIARTILFIPGIVSFVVSGVLWKLIYDPNIGTLNKTLEAIGLGGLKTFWLANPATVLPSIIVVSLWGALGTNMLIFFAGIQGVDPTYYEAAQVDGASKVQQFFYVTVPGLRVITGIVVSLNLLNGFKVFDIIYVMTGGGPNHASEVLGTYLYSLAFGTTSGAIPQLGYASAFSVIVMIMCLIAVIIQQGITRWTNR
jgi:multiple sugar transport system permease protein/raffinose/stachyose/melibiose transport system permease protein